MTNRRHRTSHEPVNRRVVEQAVASTGYFDGAGSGNPHLMGRVRAFMRETNLAGKDRGQIARAWDEWLDQYEQAIAEDPMPLWV